MKTDTETLRKRGFLTNTEAEPYFLYSKEELLELLKDKITLIILLIILVLISLVQVRMSKKRLRRKEKRYEYNKKCNSLKYSNKQNK